MKNSFHSRKRRPSHQSRDAAATTRSLLLSSLRFFYFILMSTILICVADAADDTNQGHVLVTQPDNGLSILKGQLKAATKTINMTIYELVDADIEQILVDAAARKVVVRVILDRNREETQNRPAYDFLAAGGVQVKWAPPQFAATHSKSVIIDDAIAFIMTNNLDSQYYSTGRDFGLVDTDPADIAAIGQVFEGDFKGRPLPPPTTANLMWSPTQSERAILNLINTAQATLTIENEEMAYGTIVDALINAAKRGVQVRLTMTSSKDWVDSFDNLAAAGVQIAVYAPDAPLYIHAKVILEDYGTANQRLLIGSQNFSYDSLNRNREIGLTVTDSAILSSVAATLAKDFSGGRSWLATPSNR
jgi:cardiolipin synthase A/B